MTATEHEELEALRANHDNLLESLRQLAEGLAYGGNTVYAAHLRTIVAIAKRNIPSSRTWETCKDCGKGFQPPEVCGMCEELRIGRPPGK